VNRTARLALGFGLILCLTLGVALRDRRPAQAAERSAQPPAGAAQPSGADASAPAPRSRVELLKSFIDRLGALRAGDDSARNELFAAAEQLCAEHGRCDPRDVAQYYASLTPAERAQGLEDERAYAKQWTRVRRASREGMQGEAWRTLRDEILETLAAFSAEVLARPDFVPAARALSLRTRLVVERLQTDHGLTEREAADLARTAQADARRAIAVFERAGQVTPRLEPLWLLGRIDLVAGDLAGARGWFRRCLDASRATDNASFREHALQGLVTVARRLGDVRTMDRLLAEIATFRSPAESWPLAREHGSRLLHEDHAEEALEFLLRHAPLEPVYRIQWHFLVGGAFLRTGDLVAARRQFEALGTERMNEAAILARATVDVRVGRHQDVVDVLESDATIAFTTQGRTEALALLGEALLGIDDVEGAVEALEAALEIATLYGGATPDAQRGSVMGEWLGLHSVGLLAHAHALLDEPLRAARVIEDYQSRSLRLVDDGAPRPLTFDHLRGWAASTEHGLVTWVVGADAGVVAHVAPDGSATAASLSLGRKAVRRAVRRMREAILTGDEARAQEIGTELLAALLPDEVRARALPPRTSSADAPRLLFLLHGPLEAFPVEFLDLGVTPLVLPGLMAEAPGAWSPPDEPWTLLGHPLGSDGSALLSGARGELEDVASLHPDARLCIAAGFDRASLEAALAGRGPVHVATHLLHGCGSPSARLTGVGLQLSDGDCFSAADVERLAPRLPLVVLAACETGGGDFVDAEGFMGLARGFLEGGTKNLVVTSWPVEDEAARRFSRFLHEELGRGDEPSRAAHRARARLRAEGWPAAEWAAFRLLGRH